MNAAHPGPAYAAALAALPSMTVHRLAALLRAGSPEEAFAVAGGHARPTGLIAEVLRDPTVARAWRGAANDGLVAQIWQRCSELGVQVLVAGLDDYPAALIAEVVPPPVLFALGRVSVLDGRRVAIVGTRNATTAGRSTAGRLGSELASAGVHVVSGLARGVDGSAHRGVLAAAGLGRPVGVVGSGLDVVYPPEHRDLWAAVAEHGVVLSEAPPGAPPEPWRFPQRNRIIAALAEVVVVVESRESGGSLITVDAALERGRPVMAVPGSVASRASSGTNRLLRDGAAAVLDVGDVLTTLAIDHLPVAVGAVELRRRPSPNDRAAYEVCQQQPCTLEGLAAALGCGLGEAAMSLARLRHDGWLAESDGWFEAIGSPL